MNRRELFIGAASGALAHGSPEFVSSGWTEATFADYGGFSVLSSGWIDLGRMVPAHSKISLKTETYPDIGKTYYRATVTPLRDAIISR